jgi:hypothetical protein
VRRYVFQAFDVAQVVLRNDGLVRQFMHRTKNAQESIISNQCRIFVQLVEAVP